MSAAASPWKVRGRDIEQQATTTLGSSWGERGQFQPVVSLAEIMSEELVSKLQRNEEETVANMFFPNAKGNRPSSSEAAELSGDQQEEKFFVPEEDCSNDVLLAQYLQHEFDREHDLQLSREQEKYNGNNKVRVSFEKYKTVHPVNDSESSEEDEDFREYVNHKIDTNKSLPNFGPSGIVKNADGSIVTKHDKVISARKNTLKVLEFGPGFQTGDAAGIDMQISNSVYNQLKLHSIHEEKRTHRVHDKKEKATHELALDAKTRLILFKMVNSGMLDTVTGSISTGKEAVVFHAYGGSMEGKEIPHECALKVFKTTLNEFKNRAEYVKDDYRFKNPRKVMKIWAEKEMTNLNRMQRAGINCPAVVKLRKHVLVMSFIGSGGIPAPKLHEAELNEEQLQTAYNECVEAVRTLYDQCNLVHADLSEFNILYWDGYCWLIDVSQAVDTSHPKSLLFLARDCHHLTVFFQRRGLENMPTAREFFNGITGLNIQSEENFYSEVQEFQVENRNAQLRKDKSNPADCTLRKFIADERENESQRAE